MDRQETCGLCRQIKSEFSARIVKSYNISIFSGERAEREESSSLSVVEPESNASRLTVLELV